MEKAGASSFKIRDKKEVKAEIRRSLEAKVGRRGIIEGEARTGEEMRRPLGSVRPTRPRITFGRCPSLLEDWWIQRCRTR